MSCVLREAHGVVDLLALAAAWPRRYPCLLESAAQANAAQNAALARYDMLFACSGDALIMDGDGRVRDAQGKDRGERFLDALDADWRTQFMAPRAKVDSESLPFRGGWVLFLGYELGAEIEAHLQRMTDSDSTLPVAMALRCPAAIVVDRHAGKTWMVAETECAEWLDAMQADLAAVPQLVPESIAHAQIDEDDPQIFLDGVARVHEYLQDGDVFQVNLSRAWCGRFAEPPSPTSLYASLRAANPAPFAGLLQWNGWAIASSSPERLVEVHGERVQTRPIAGTRPRFADDDDALRMRELAGHPKERAEHIMLIDLERNDLGRISVPGSIVVDELMGVESYAHVHHIVSNVCGRLRAGVTPAQVIRAVFPGGTITGAPKVRTMQIITELERCARGAYTGALGYLNRDGDMDLNILIRTLHLHGSEVRFRAGAGIVADSVALRELEETRAKARGLLRALGASA